MRLLFGVVTGYLIFAVSAVLLFQLTQQDPHATPSPVFAAVSVLWGIGFAVLGGFMASKAAPCASLLPSVLVGCLIAAGALISLFFAGLNAAIWSQVSALLLMAPAACAGGLINRHRQR